MSERRVAVSHLTDATFDQGLREVLAYRDLGIATATGGHAVAHVIRANEASETVHAWHSHETNFQMIYVLKGWAEFEYEGQGLFRFETGSCFYQPPSVRHREIAHSDDLEMLEIVLPGEFKTIEDA